MGSIITLGVKKMDVDWGKNNIFLNHSILFQEKDFDIELPYYYIDDESEKIIYEKGASKKLKHVKERLDLLGYDLDSCERDFNDVIKTFEFSLDTKIEFSFNDFKECIKNINVNKVNNIKSAIESFENGYDLGEFFSKAILTDTEFLTKMKKHLKKEINILDAEFFENIHPYIILRLLAENNDNLEYDVEWRYSDVIENGWVEKSKIIEPVPQKDKILIVTEGTTDSFIIKKTIHELYNYIEDLFEFIDMHENYPFTNTGSLTNFCMGLHKIKILNYVIAIYDNDTAGIQSYNKAKQICTNENMLIYHLPYMEEFKSFKTIGPEGISECDINNKAVAIECFLDFKSVSDDPIVRWSNYNDAMAQYQGSLINKDNYTRAFKMANLNNGTYDVHKLRYLIEDIIKKWINRNNKK